MRVKIILHMLVSIPPKLSMSQFMGYLKGKSSLMIFDKHANLKYKYGNMQFWCKGYYVDTVGRDTKVIEEYIKNKIQEDIAYEQLSLKEYIDPFGGPDSLLKNSGGIEVIRKIRRYELYERYSDSFYIKVG